MTAPTPSLSWGLVAAGLACSALGAALIVLYIASNRRAREHGARAAWRSGWLLGAPGMAALFAGWGIAALSGPRLPGWLPRAAGGVLLGAALGVYFLGARRVGRWRRPAVYSTALRVDGIYRRVRHPQALALCLAAPGLPLAAASVPSLCIAPLWIAFWVAYTHLEERCELIPVFGEAYLRYRETTPRLLPRIPFLSRRKSYRNPSSAKACRFPVPRA